MNLTLKNQLSIMAVISITAVMLLTGMGYLLGKNASIGSSAYQNIQSTSVFVADIAPPSLFMVEVSNKSEQLYSLDKKARPDAIKEIRKYLSAFNESAEKWEASSELPADIKSDIAKKLKPQAKIYQDYLIKNILNKAEAGEDEALLAAYPEVEKLFNEHAVIVNDLVSRAVKLNEAAQAEGTSKVASYQQYLTITAIFSALAVLFSSIYFTKLILSGLGTDPSELQRIANSVASGTVNISLPPVENANSVLAAMAAMLETNKANLLVAQENLRIKQALDATSSNVMLADASRNIIYMNKAAEKMLRGVESEVRQSLPHFSADKILGNNMDIFNKNSQQYSSANNSREAYTDNITVGKLAFRLIASPVFDEKGIQLGSVQEWIDRTHVIEAENEMRRVMGALEATSSNVMVADPDRKIIYMNGSVEKMLRSVELDLRKALPQFSVDKVIGSSMDSFHRNPSHQSNLLANLKDTYVGNIVVAGLSFRLIANPIFTESGERLGTVVEWLDRTKEVAAEHELSRIMGAIETATTNIMIADNDRKIIYMNKSVENMLRVAEADLRKALPHFSVSKVLGSNMDIFHKNPAHQMQLLANLTTTYVGNIVVGGRHFRLIANPIFSKDGTRIGSVVEWLDRTQEVSVESEVSGVVQSAGLGDFKARIPTEGKTGFFLTLAEGLNTLMQTSDVGLGEVNRVLSAIAKGDLTERITNEYFGTFGDLKDYCNQTAKNLTEMMTEIRTAAETIFTASSEIASGNADLSSRTEQQAANLEETASSMEELTSTVKLNADNAKQANVLAEKASTVASDGGELIQQVVITMSSINESSQKIADIIGVIDGIAFQTNILALNAAVEAARAGDQGRGFAVVASEVRTLAQRSANAAKDIKGLISDSVKKIESGNTLVGKSGDTMKEIVTAIKRVNDIMAEIAAASSEQSTGIEEVSNAVSQMDEMTQQNAALVEEAAAAAESLQSQADQLTQRVGEFKLTNDVVGRRQQQPAVRLPSPKLAAKPSTGKKLAPPKNQDDEWESF